MEKDLNLNSQVCTSVEQSKRLLKLGLKPKTADCMYSVMTKSYNGRFILEKDRRYTLCLFRQEEVQSVGFSHYEHIPAWSLHRLIELYKDVEDISIWSLKNVNYDRLIQCIGLAIKHNDFNNEYLIQ